MLFRSSSAQHYNRHEPERVEVTPPGPVRTAPYSTALRTTGVEGKGGRGGNGSDGGNGWQYRNKPKRPVKAVLVSFLAGMVVLSGSMFASDHYNWFTGGQQVTAPVDTVGTAITTSENAGVTPSTSTASLTNETGDVTSVVDGVGPAIVKIETLVNSSNRSRSQSRQTDPFSQFFLDRKSTRLNSSHWE